jgi:hypothetical protein
MSDDVEAAITNALAQFDALARDMERESRTSMIVGHEALGLELDWDVLDPCYEKFRRTAAVQRAKIPEMIRRAAARVSH